MGVALLFGLLFLYLLFFVRGCGSCALLSHRSVGEIRVNHVVKRRSPGSLEWEVLGKGSVLYVGDILYVSKAGPVPVFSRKGPTLELPADSLVQIVESAPQRSEVSVLDVPHEFWRPLPHGLMRRLLPDPYPLEYRLGELKHRLKTFVSRAASPPRFRELANYDLDEPSDYELKLIRPISQTFDRKETPSVTMVWTPVPIKNVLYSVEVSKDPSFEVPITQSTAVNQLSMPFEEAAVYYWRVHVRKGNDVLSSSEAKFTIIKKKETSIVTRLPLSTLR